MLFAFVAKGIQDVQLPFTPNQSITPMVLMICGDKNPHPNKIEFSK